MPVVVMPVSSGEDSLEWVQTFSTERDFIEVYWAALSQQNYLLEMSA